MTGNFVNYSYFSCCIPLVVAGGNWYALNFVYFLLHAMMISSIYQNRCGGLCLLGFLILQ